MNSYHFDLIKEDKSLIPIYVQASSKLAAVNRLREIFQDFTFKYVNEEDWIEGDEEVQAEFDYS